MNTKIAESLGLFEGDESNQPASEAIEPREINEIIADANEVINALEMSEKIDHALATVANISAADTEMDDIAVKALKAYQDLCDASVNMPDNYVGRVYEVAATMLKVALDAREAKLNRKLKTIELQIKKAALDKNSGDSEPKQGQEGKKIDRNYLISLMRKDKDA